jgi:hypothetical protein
MKSGPYGSWSLLGPSHGGVSRLGRTRTKPMLEC